MIDKKGCLIGLSLSMCIRDMINGKMTFGSVKCIISGTKIENDNDFAAVRDRYCKTYWAENPIMASNLLRGLYDGNMLVQPRVLGIKPMYIADGHWFMLLNI